MTVDGLWCAIGSSSFDDRSFETNGEITLGIADAATAKRVDAIFERYLPRCTEIMLDEWPKRPLWHKTIDSMYYMINEVL